MIIEKINPGIFHIDVVIKEIIFGNTMIDKITGFDQLESTTMKLRCLDCTVMVFKSDMMKFRDYKVGDNFKALVKEYKKNIYNFKEILE